MAGERSASLHHHGWSAVPHDRLGRRGGAIVTWSDGRALDGYNDIYAQRLNAAGVPQWASNGVALCTAQYNQASPTIASDGAGGAIVTWQDNRISMFDVNIYAQRVYGSGGVVAVSPPGAPAHFQLFAPSPNPARDGQLTIRFSLPSTERVSAQVLDVEGRRVRTLATDRPPSSPCLRRIGHLRVVVDHPQAASAGARINKR